MGRKESCFFRFKIDGCSAEIFSMLRTLKIVAAGASLLRTPACRKCSWSGNTGALGWPQHLLHNEVWPAAMTRACAAFTWRWLGSASCPEKLCFGKYDSDVWQSRSVVCSRNLLAKSGSRPRLCPNGCGPVKRAVGSCLCDDLHKSANDEELVLIHASVFVSCTIR
jgi:hypothetical protein